jgi:uncharacterized membrane protein
MIDLHPPASGLPLASVLLLCAAEMFRCLPRTRTVGESLRTAAVVSCIVAVAAAFVSGYQASSRALDLVPHVETAMGQHHALGKALLVTSLLLGTFFYLSRIATHGKKAFCFLYYLVCVLQVIGTIWVGSLGGQLVFVHGVNVSRHADSPLQ